MKKIKFTAAILGPALLLACGREPSSDSYSQGIFSIEIMKGRASSSKSLLGEPPEIETKITGVSLAAYSRGRLQQTAHFEGGRTQNLEMRLENLEDYKVYALVNMGDMTEDFPAFESSLEDMRYTLTPYYDSEDSISGRGIPMCGQLDYHSGGSTVIRVERLLAKVTVNICCDWPGGRVLGVIAGNMNGELSPFGESAIGSTGDVFSYEPDMDMTEMPSATASLVMYIPENVQGIIGNAASPEDKTHEKSPEIDSMKDFLSYMEVGVEGSGIYSGVMVYRHYLGNNATNDFSIERNCEYVWDITYSEDRLYLEEWKYDSSHLEDLRYLSVKEKDYVEIGDVVSLGKYVSSNIPLSSLSWSYFDENGNAMGTIYSNRLDGESFMVGSEAWLGDILDVNIHPSHNQRPNLEGKCRLTVVEKNIMWMGTRWYLNPGSSTNARLLYSVFDGAKEISLPGMYREEWNIESSFPMGINYGVLPFKEYDNVSFTASRTALPASYSVTAATGSGRMGTGTLTVNDTRILAWTNRSGVSASSMLKYVWDSSRDIHLFFLEGSGYMSANGSRYNAVNSPFRFMATDINGVSSFEGVRLSSSNILSRIGLDSSLASFLGPPSFSFIGADNLAINYLPNLSGTPSVGDYSFSLYAVHNSSEASRHSITANIHIIPRSGTRTVETFLLVPAGRVEVLCGESVSFAGKYSSYTFTNGSFTSSSTAAVSASSIRWEGAPGGVFSSSLPGLYIVKGTYTRGGISLTANTLVNVCKREGGISGNWDEYDEVILD